MKTKLMALEALKFANSGYHTAGDIYSKAIAALETDIAKPVEPVAFLLLPGCDGEEFSDDFELKIVFKEAEKLQEALVKFSDQDGVTIPLYTTPQEPAAAGWIPASERLPDPWVAVSVYPYPSDYCKEAQMGRSGAAVFWKYAMPGSDDGEVRFEYECEVTHWMPLPAAPGGAA